MVKEIPLSFAQQRLWFLEQMARGKSAFQLPAAWRLSGELQVEVFEQALNEIIRRHNILRAKFKTVDGQPVQVIDKVESVVLPIVDFANFPAAEREAEVQRYISVEAQRPFDLARGPVWRATLLKLDATEYIFFLALHNMVAEARSVEIFFHELGVLYKAFCNREASPLPELPVQYADFARHQREQVRGEMMEQQLAYWRHQLAGAPPILELPADRPRPAVQTFSGAAEFFRLPKKLFHALQSFSQQHCATLLVTLLTAFVVLLQRYTGLDDICIGMLQEDGALSEFSDIIGMFANTLVMRLSQLSDNPSVLDLLAQVKAVALEALAYQDLPFEKLVEELQPERNLSITPFFQALFVSSKVVPHACEWPGLAVRPVAVHNGAAKFDLTLKLEELPDDELSGALEYNVDLLDAATIHRLRSHYEHLLQSIVDHPEQRISDLAMLAGEERQQILQEWNDTQRDYACDRCVHHLFEAQVERTPDAVAIVFRHDARDGFFAEQQLTYRELNHRANQLAHVLKKIGVGPETLVGICLERSLETVIGLWGVLKAGGAYVPLDPAYPPERLALVLEDACLPVLLTQKRIIDNSQFSFTNCQLLYLDEWEKISSAAAVNPSVEILSENLAYAIYTSGSTGKPKGVAIPHRALTNFLQSMRQTPGLTEQDVMLAVTTISFDIAGLELYLPLTVGGCVVLASRETASDARRLMAALENSGATVMQATPATWRMLIEAGWQGRQNLKILCGGEAMPAELAKLLLPRSGELWNMYGPTETTIWSSVDKIESVDGSALSIGRPIANTQIYLLDRHLQVVPAGTKAALHIGGDGLARGYLNRPELTAEKFVPDAYAEKPGVRIYHTGDLARYRAGGKIDCLGRSDYQVKIRGFRVELGEIESALALHPAIAQIVVIVREDESNDAGPTLGASKRLVAYLTPKTELGPHANELREFLRAKLPEYMIPTAFVFLETLPLTPNGKVDRRALPKPERTAFQPGAAYEAPQNLVEELLGKIWEDVLGVERVGVNDNFFELGGQSLLAVSMLVQIENSFHRSLPLASLFKAPTIRQLAAMLGAAEQATVSDCLVALQEGVAQGAPPLFFVSGGGGHVFNFSRLARCLGSEQAVYGLHFPGLDGRREPLRTVEEIAAEFIRHVSTIQPQGPYYLCGFCFGGLVVYEMAQQLTQQGQQVATLFLLDIAAPQASAPQPANLRVKVGDHSGSPSLADWIKAVRRANNRAQKSYQPQPYPGRAVVFVQKKARNEADHEGVMERRHGWDELALGGVETYGIGGHHSKWFREPKVHRLASQMRRWLPEVQS